MTPDLTSTESHAKHGASLASGQRIKLLFARYKLLALLLAVAGIYGSIAEDIAQRRREIGIRAALGAHPREILILFVRRGLLLTVIGSLSGLAGMLAVRKIVARLLYATASTDPVAIGSVMLLLIVAAVLTCVVSAYAAVRVDPIQTLRHD
jgi:ABC-type antimicrobial peptide transport system permease subunit